MKSVLLLFALLVPMLSHAADSSTAPSTTAGAESGRSPPPDEARKQGHNAAIDAALRECATANSQGQDDRPDQQKMEACMTAKGFPKPGGGRRPPPHDGDAPVAPAGP